MTKAKKQKVVVTGAGGFIGKNLCRYLAEQPEYDVIALDIVRPADASGNFFQGDFSTLADDYPDLLTDVDCVFHLAAIVGVDNCAQNPERVEEVNLQKTKGFIDYCAKQGVKRFVFSSSSEVYANLEEVPYREEADVTPFSLYGKCKLAIEHYLRERASSFPNGVGVARFFNIYGPGQRKEFVATKFIDLALHNLPIEVYGTGDQTRCFTYIQDAVRGFVAISRYHDSSFEIFNIGSQQEYSIKELAEVCLEVVPESKSKIVFKDYGKDGVREGALEIKRRVPATEKAKELLGFEATVTLREGLKSMMSE